MKNYVSWTQILGASLIGAAFFFFIVLPVLVRLYRYLFSARIKVIKGEILNLNVAKIASDGKIIGLDFYVIIEDSNNGKRRSIKISKEDFAQLNEKRKFFLNKNILIYFKDHFFSSWENEYDHFEIA
ncbi:MAG: hypothetical protein WCW54_02690 [Candidatus Paceibacterota bacterium]